MWLLSGQTQTLTPAHSCLMVSVKLFCLVGWFFLFLQFRMLLFAKPELGSWNHT